MIASNSYRFVPLFSELICFKFNQHREKKKFIQKNESVLETAKQFDGCTDARFILKFLRARKFDIKKAADLYTNYYEKRSLLCGVSRLQEGEAHFKIEIKALAEKYGDFIAVLDELDAHGRKVIICRENVFSVNGYFMELLINWVFSWFSTLYGLCTLGP